MGKPAYNNAGVYALFLPVLRAVARKHGYALGVHGSLLRDCDLIAAPWTEDASSASELAGAMADAVGGTLDHPHPGLPPGPSLKPHGRKGWNIYLGGGSLFFDVSIMPRTKEVPHV